MAVNIKAMRKSNVKFSGVFLTRLLNLMALLIAINTAWKNLGNTEMIWLINVHI